MIKDCRRFLANCCRTWMIDIRYGVRATGLATLVRLAHMAAALLHGEVEPLLRSHPTYHDRGMAERRYRVLSMRFDLQDR